MHINRQFSVLAVAAGLLLNSGIGNATDVYARKTTAAVTLSDLGGTPVTVLSVSIPAGTWKATAKSSVINFGTADIARCLITSSTATTSSQIDSAATHVGSATGSPIVATIANEAVITTSGTTTFSLKCQHDSSISGLYVDPDAKLIVERVSSGLSNL